MLEIIMVISLALMGVYFYKSTDLPKELKERSAQLKASSDYQDISKKPFKIAIPKVSTTTSKTASKEKNTDDLLVQMKLQKKQKQIAVLNQEIDRLTLEITTLEQEIKDNNERNVEIQKTIDAHLITLVSLKEQIDQLV